MILSKISPILKVTPCPTTSPLSKIRTSPVHSVPFPPFLVIFAKPLAMVSATVIGRGARFAWGRIAAAKKTELKKKWTKWLWITGGVMGGCVGWGYASHVKECPYTGRRKFVALSTEQINRIAEEALEGLLEEYEEDIVENNNLLYQQVTKVANRILEGNKDIPEIFGKNWTILLVNKDIENAFVLPTGHIFVFKGMWDLCSNDGKLNEDKLGIILGHEMAHAILGHTAEKLSRSSLIESCLLVPMAVMWAFVPSDGIAFITHWFISKVVDICIELPFSREIESEADSFGLKLAAKACFDVREAPAFWMSTKLMAEMNATLEECTKDNADIVDADSYRTLELYLSTHPADDTRHKQLQESMKEALAIRQECRCPHLDSDYDPCKLVDQMREWWDDNKDALIKDTIEAKQSRRLRNTGVPLAIPDLNREKNYNEEKPGTSYAVQVFNIFKAGLIQGKD
eukprot:GFUD01010583.1.p1 GENE.GFUD01010583.1~~GFUD01010583.1.p1  ORF type:complete len:457 (-),score=103.11 GFUD01010583.1:147-1517(-)